MIIVYCLTLVIQSWVRASHFGSNTCIMLPGPMQTTFDVNFVCVCVCVCVCARKTGVPSKYVSYILLARFKLCREKEPFESQWRAYLASSSHNIVSSSRNLIRLCTQSLSLSLSHVHTFWSMKAVPSLICFWQGPIDPPRHATRYLSKFISGCAL